MRALEFITGHVIFKLHYNQIYQLKTTLVIIFSKEFSFSIWFCCSALWCVPFSTKKIKLILNLGDYILTIIRFIFSLYNLFNLILFSDLIFKRVFVHVPHVSHFPRRKRFMLLMISEAIRLFREFRYLKREIVLKRFNWFSKWALAQLE